MTFRWRKNHWKIFYFNSHAHVERDGYVRKYCQNYIISTHTLTWSVTGCRAFLAKTSLISTHTLTWSVTEYELHHKYLVKISTHTLTWSVTFIYVILAKKHIISTHTLTWSVTQNISIQYIVYRISTHTLTWSVTWLQVSLPLALKFQLTRSRGAWQISSVLKGVTINFNSHAHVERDAF